MRAPGSSANLGPGFDVLGVALTRYAWASNEPGEGDPCGPDHIARIAYEQAGGDGSIWFRFELEPGRGLGFSAAARAAGAVLAGLEQGDSPTEARDRAYPVVAEIEGHGDNAAPSVFGGIQLVSDSMTHQIGTALPGQLLLWLADADNATDASRSVLPQEVPLEDAVFNLGRLGLLVAAIYEGRADLLRQATQDRVHQPTRLAENQASADAIEAAIEAGALAAWLSGSGPAVAVLADPQHANTVAEALPSSGSVLTLDVDTKGAEVESR